MTCTSACKLFLVDRAACHITNQAAGSRQCMPSAYHALRRSASSARPSVMSECGRQASSRGTAHRSGRCAGGWEGTRVHTRSAELLRIHLQFLLSWMEAPRLPAIAVPPGRRLASHSLTRCSRWRREARRHAMASVAAPRSFHALHMCAGQQARMAVTSPAQMNCIAGGGAGGGGISSGGAVVLHPRTALSTGTFGRPPRPQGACE